MSLSASSSSSQPATAAEREAELIALQGAFDEYIASSRELEEELDAELAKMQTKHAESAAANMALSAQLENISPQLVSLESALSASRAKLKDEQALRRAAEQAQDEADQRVRALEQSLQTLRDECDDVHEELAFKENELEETRLELEVEKQQLENELASLRQRLVESSSVVSAPVERSVSADVTTVVATASEGVTTTTSAAEADEGYAQRLEEELELVTEQLIDTEKRLSEAETELRHKESLLLEAQEQRGANADGSKFLNEADANELVNELSQENSALRETEQRLRSELATAEEELSLCREENHLQTEELVSLEQVCQATTQNLEAERAEHSQEVHQLQHALTESETVCKQSRAEAALAAANVQSAQVKHEVLQEQLAALENALENSKKDYQSCLDELDQVHARFDEARHEANRAGRESALEEARTAMRTDVEHELKSVQETLARLSVENQTLLQAVDDANMKLAAAKDQHENAANSSAAENATADSQVVKQLQSQLTRVKEDLLRKETEMAAFTTEMGKRLQTAEQTVTHVEAELHNAKGQLAEAEAHLIVLRLEKERKEHTIPKVSVSSPSRADAPDGASTGASFLDEESAAVGDCPRTPNANRGRSSSPSSVMRLEMRLVEAEKKSATLEKEYNEVVDQKRMSEVRVKRLEEDVKVMQRQLFSMAGNSGDAAITTQMSRLSSLGNAERGMDLMSLDEVAGERVEKIIGTRDLKLLADELKSLDKKCNSQREYNAQLLSKMLHLQGNIQVYCRIRPMSMPEIQSGARSVVEPLSETEVGCFDQRTNKWKSFAFDRVWGPDQSQTSIFQDVEPLALSVVDGFNACIFAYGQTGSGKTYTMEGTQEANQYGISYRTIQKIFHLLNLRAQQQRTAEMFVGSEDEKEEVSFSFSLKVGMLEIYNDEVYDLLATAGASMQQKKDEAMRAGGKSSLEIRRDKDGRVEVPNLTKETVNSIQEVMVLLKRGNSNRATATTEMNEHSSRSHMVLNVDVESGLGQSSMNKGTLYLVDLAGSERVRKSNVEGDNLKEAGFINKSLSALGNVMEALDRRASHIPYRDSKLTALLQNSLGGNSRTMMVVTACPMDNSFDESVHALQFATRVRRIQIGAAQRNVTSKNLEETVRTLTEEMRILTRAKERTEGQLTTLKRDNDRVQDKLQNISKSRTQGRNDSKTLDVLRKSNDEMASRWEKEKVAREETAEELEKTRKEVRMTQQQLGRFKSKLEQLEQKLEDKERALERANDELRQERNRKSAATVRSRRNDVLGTKSLPPPSPLVVPSSPSTRPAAAKMTPTTQSVVGEASGESDDVLKIRSQVLALLEKYDTAKVDRIDIIMEKFKGKEALLLEKMSQRYEAGSTSSQAATFASRNAMALQRHHERMQRINEKRGTKPNGV